MSATSAAAFIDYSINRSSEASSASTWRASATESVLQGRSNMMTHSASPQVAAFPLSTCGSAALAACKSSSPPCFSAW